jgi:thioredoxin
MKLSLVSCLLPVLLVTSCDKLKELKVKKEESAAASSGPPVAPLNASELVRYVDEADFESFIAIPDRVVLVDFTATWCPPCQALGPRLEAAAQAHGGRVLLGKVDVDRNQSLAQRMGVSGIPDVRIYVNGVEVDRFVGGLNEAGIRAKLEPALAKVPEVAAGPPEPAADAPATTAEPMIQPMKKDWLPEGMERR